jgi:hypothetical protein
MGNTKSSSQKINFEDVQYALKNHESYILINTLSEAMQNCLIKNTIKAENEVAIMNKLITNGNKNINIIVYGMNSNDDKIFEKQNQLYSLGFYNVYIYVGGMFEWLLLQDIYGTSEFPTTTKELDILKYKSRKSLNIRLIEY